MDLLRIRRAKRNIAVSILSQVVVLLCGLIVPKLMISTFGSEAYGATTSITQFLAYIVLLEGGIGGVARAALYKPLAENDIYTISAVNGEIKSFFRVIAYIFLAYVILLSVSFKAISHVEIFDWITTAILVLVISISTFAQYYIGISYSILIQASQKTYITQSINIITTLLNTFLIIVFIKLGSNLVLVKLISSAVFILRPVLMWLYVKTNYKLVCVKNRNKELLSSKWTGLGQHIAFFLHSNTDIAVLTIFTNLTNVAVYSVHNMVASNLQSFTSSFSSGMEALFGDMIARNERDKLNNTFTFYESMISYITVLLFSVATVLIDPFISVYTSQICDAIYFQPIFSRLLLLASILYCLRLPYHSVTIAAGHFRQTKYAAYGEAILNILISVILVKKNGLIGVSVGTVAATSYRFIYYVWYLSKNICYRSILLFLKRTLVNAFSYVGVCYIGEVFIRNRQIDNYLQWLLNGIIVFIIAFIIVTCINAIIYKKDTIKIIKRLVYRKKKRVS